MRQNWTIWTTFDNLDKIGQFEQKYTFWTKSDKLENMDIFGPNGEFGQIGYVDIFRQYE